VSVANRQDVVGGRVRHQDLVVEGEHRVRVGVEPLAVRVVTLLIAADVAGVGDLATRHLGEQVAQLTCGQARRHLVARSIGLDGVVRPARHLVRTVGTDGERAVLARGRDEPGHDVVQVPVPEPGDLAGDADALCVFA